MSEINGGFTSDEERTDELQRDGVERLVAGELSEIDRRAVLALIAPGVLSDGNEVEGSTARLTDGEHVASKPIDKLIPVSPDSLARLVEGIDASIESGMPGLISRRGRVVGVFYPMTIVEMVRGKIDSDSEFAAQLAEAIAHPERTKLWSELDGGSDPLQEEIDLSQPE